MVMARTGGDGAAGIFRLAGRERDARAWLGAQERKKIGMARPADPAVSLEGCFVLAKSLLGAEGQGFKIAMAGLDGGRLNIGACSLGGGQAALDKTVRYLRERKAFGRSLDEFQAAQFRLADMATELEAARAFFGGRRRRWAPARRAPRRFAPWPSASRPTPDSPSPMTRCNCMAVMAIYATMGSRRSSAICGCIKFSKAPMKSCASSSRGIYWERRGDMSETDLLISRIGHLGSIRLNRPKALNSLTLGMVRIFARALDEFGLDASIHAVLVDGRGRARALRAAAIYARYTICRLIWRNCFKAFWREEYQLNARIASFPKPYVAVMDGVVMGGGVGISAHGNRRVATERTRLAMPETGIGFIRMSAAPGC